MPLRDKDVVNDKKKKNKTKTKLIYDHFPNTISTPLRDKYVVNDKKKQEKQIYTTKQKTTTLHYTTPEESSVKLPSGWKMKTMHFGNTV